MVSLTFEVLLSMGLIAMMPYFYDIFRFVLGNLRVNFVLCVMKEVLLELVLDRVKSQF